MPQEKKSSLVESLEALSKIRKSPALALLIPTGSLHVKHLFEVQKLLRGKQLEQIDLIIYSGGGDINVAYQIATLLRRHAKKVIALIPLYAKSAATLLTISSEEIIMGECAELGPLDTQMLEVEQGGKRKYNSALNPFKTLEQLQRFSLETLDVTNKMILNRSNLNIDEAIKLGIDFVSRIASPLFSQLKTDKLGEYSRALAVGKEYGERLLKTNPSWRDDSKREQILERLVRGYPAHDYIIDFEELKEMGFNARLPNASEEATFCNLMTQMVNSAKLTIKYIDYNAKTETPKDAEEKIIGTEKIK